MAQHAPSQHQDGVGAVRAAGVGPQSDRSEAPPLTDLEARILDCLRNSADGLTARQIESRCSCDSQVLGTALQTLLERRLAARLNTIVPSYTARLASPPVDTR